MRRIERKKKPNTTAKSAKKEPFFKGVQTKVSIGEPNDHYEKEADAMADAVTSGKTEGSSIKSKSGNQSETQAKPLAQQITPLVQRAPEEETQPKLQRMEEEEAQTKVQRAEEEEAQPKLQLMEEEEAQTKVQRAEEEEAQPKLQRMEEEEAQTKVQRAQEEEAQPKLQLMEEEEAQTKVQRAEEEEAQPKLQLMEEEEAQTKVQRMEEEEAQTKVQRAEEEEAQAKVQRMEEEEAQAKEAKSSSVKPSMESTLKSKKGSGSKMDSNTKAEMESGFGADFSGVNIHTDTKSQEMSQEIGAQAFTHGNDVYFNEGKYKPQSQEGKHLLAHELTHTIQQGKSNALLNKKGAKGSSTGKGGNITKKEEGEVLQKQDQDGLPNEDKKPEGDKKPDTAPKMKPETALPTLGISANTLNRGDTLTAALKFTAVEKGSLKVNSWSYASAGHGAVSRSSTDTTFNKEWKGLMADSGTLAVVCQVISEDGSAGGIINLSESVTVNDRSDAQFKADMELKPEVSFGGQPSPPTKFSELGVHEDGQPAITLAPKEIKEGPNQGLTFIESITAGKYSSEGKIHPALSDPASSFHVFHTQTGLLWVEVDATGALTKVPAAEFSALKDTGGSFSFQVPDWEAFYKKYDYYGLTAVVNKKITPVPKSLWTLSPNTEPGNLTPDDAKIKAHFKVTSPGPLTYGIVNDKSFSAKFLMPSAKILAGTKSHEYVHNTHSHRANFKKIVGALDPQRILESKVSSATTAFDFAAKLTDLSNEIDKPNHTLVDETQSRTTEKFVDNGQEMAGVNVDPASGNTLGSVWDITGDKEMT